MENKKAQVGLGGFILLFITLVAGLALYQGILPMIGDTTNTVTGTNVQFTVPADGVTIDITGQELVGTPTVANATGPAIPATNYTMDEGVSTTTGVKTIRYTAIGDVFAGETMNITYVYGPDGYIDSSAGRSLALLIPIFAALALAIAAMSESFRGGLMDLIGK